MRYQRYLLSLIVVFAALVVPAAASAHVRHAKPCVVPHVTGESLRTARRKIDRAGCKVGKITRPKIASGALVVKSTTPKAGRHVKQGTRVRVVLKAKQPKPTATTNMPVGVTAPTPVAPTISYSSKVDPTFTQAAANPLQVTYDYSADATETINGTTIDMGQAGDLPAGVLNLYSTSSSGIGSNLVCAMNVGNSTVGGQCTVTYSQLATYTITTQYVTSSASSTTNSEQVTLQPGTPTVSGSIGVVTAGGPTPLPTLLTPTSVVQFPLALTSSLASGGNAPAFTVTLTDETTGTSITGNAATTFDGDQCEMQFITSAVTSSEITDDLNGCGLPTQTFGITDTIDATLNEAATATYSAASTAPVQVWPLPGVMMWPDGVPIYCSWLASPSWCTTTGVPQ